MVCTPASVVSSDMPISSFLTFSLRARATLARPSDIRTIIGFASLSFLISLFSACRPFDSPEDNGVFPPVGSSLNLLIAKSTLDDGCSSICESSPRKANNPILSLFWYESINIDRMAPFALSILLAAPMEPLASTTKSTTEETFLIRSFSLISWPRIFIAFSPIRES
ncbi:Uncharacterised protein [uncultured archaeon]|nr:Uncharacterised protein [uncultured archaeon]